MQVALWKGITGSGIKGKIKFIISCCFAFMFFPVLQGRSCDKGQSFLSEAPESPATLSYRNIIQSKSENHCANESSQF